MRHPATIRVTAVERPAGFHWLGEHNGRVVLWDATPHPSEAAAMLESVRLHEQWRREGNTFPYGGMQ